MGCTPCSPAFTFLPRLTPPRSTRLMMALLTHRHNLGLTCDPLGGLVQIPCIERNSLGAVKAVTAAQLAMAADGEHTVSLDDAIEACRTTAMDMHSHYKETSLGGLAASVKIPLCEYATPVMQVLMPQHRPHARDKQQGAWHGGEARVWNSGWCCSTNGLGCHHVQCKMLCGTTRAHLVLHLASCGESNRSSGAAWDATSCRTVAVAVRERRSRSRSLRKRTAHLGLTPRQRP